MCNAEIVALFVEVLLQAPELTMQAVQVRLSCTDYELVLKKADPLKEYEKQWNADHPDPYQFPFMAGERMVPSL